MLIPKTLVSAAFVGSNLGILLSAIAVYTHYWIVAVPSVEPKAPASNSSNTTNITTETVYSQGLWKFCTDNVTVTSSTDDNESDVVVNITENCVCLLELGDIPGNLVWFRATELTFSSGSVMALMGVVVLYITLCVSRCHHHHRRLLITLKGIFLTAAGLEMAALILLGSYYKFDANFVNLANYDVNLGWSYVVGITGDVALFVTAAACGLLACHEVGDNEIPYKNLPKA